MNCAETRKYLDAFVDGELEAGLLLEVESHVDGCAPCAALAGLKRRIKAELAAAGARIAAPEGLRRRVEGLPSRRLNRRLIGAAVSVPLAAAAALLLALNVGRAPAPAPADEPLSAVVNDVVERHARDLPLEVRSADPAAATSWFQGKVDFPVRAPRLKLAGASFQGARLSNVQSAQAAHMAYTVDGHRVTLMIFPVEHLQIRGGTVVRAGNRDVLLGRHNGYNVAVTVDGDMAYAVSSDLPRERLVSLLTDMSI
jgi:anti-sigma factor (TIGR02949 family)